MDAAWAQVYAVWAQVFVGLLQTGLIGWGLYVMQQASSQRNRQLDQQGQALDQQSQVLATQSQALADIGRGIEETPQWLLRNTLYPIKSGIWNTPYPIKSATPVLTIPHTLLTFASTFSPR